MKEKITEQLIVDLIYEYSKNAEKRLKKLKKAMNIDEPIIKYIHKNKLPKEGEVEGISYQIHGIGICMYDGHSVIDVDLGENDFAGAFNAWRLSIFSESLGYEKPLSDMNFWTNWLKVLYHKGLIKKCDKLGSDFYCYLDDFQLQRDNK